MNLDRRYDRPNADNTTMTMLADVTAVVAGTLLMMAGLFDILQGLSAIADDGQYAADDYLYEFDVSTWGWVHVVMGALAVAVAVGILLGRSWGQVTGLIVAGLVMLTNFAFLPYYPFWSITVILFGGLAMWALCHLLKVDERP